MSARWGRTRSNPFRGQGHARALLRNNGFIGGGALEHSRMHERAHVIGDVVCALTRCAIALKTVALVPRTDRRKHTAPAHSFVMFIYDGRVPAWPMVGCHRVHAAKQLDRIVHKAFDCFAFFVKHKAQRSVLRVTLELA